MAKCLSDPRADLVALFQGLASDERFQNDESYVRMAHAIQLGLRLSGKTSPVDVAMPQEFLTTLYLKCNTDTARAAISDVVRKL